MEVKTTFGRALVEIAKNECDLGRKFLHELLSITEQLISVACTLWCLVLEEKKPSAFSRSSFFLGLFAWWDFLYSESPIHHGYSITTFGVILVVRGSVVRARIGVIGI